MFFARPALLLVIFAAVPCAYAASITESINTDAFSTNLEFNQTLNFAGFDPSLGTLTSVTASLEGFYTANVYPAYYDDSFFDLATPSNAAGVITVEVGFNSNSGTYTVSGSETDTNGSDLSYLTNSGAVPIDFSAFEDGRATISSTGLSASFTYTYTPTTMSATPEPSSLVLLGTGVLGLFGVLRRRTA